MDNARVRARESEAQALGVEGLYPEHKTRKGPIFDAIADELSASEWEDWVDQNLSNAEVARRIGKSATSVSAARMAAFNDRLLRVAAEGWDPTPEHARMLGPSDSEMKRLADDDPEAFEQRLDDLVAAFVEWRTKFFSVGFERAYITKPVHERWIRATLKTIYTGGRLLILSPPRHGKTELLIHFCVWLICRNPDIRILWIGPNTDIAENCLGQVRDLLENHEPLRTAYLPEGDNWAPGRRGAGLWQRTKFTVSNRTVPLKQPTMWCTGVLGKILSIDADFIVVDDPADPDTSYTPGGRDKIENWFKVKLITRKMMHTGLAMISSRVHPEDLYSNFTESENWEVVVDRAHDQAVCHLGLWDEHRDREACVLFPEVNPLEYLREQAEVVGDALFEMMYLNQPRPVGATIFDLDRIRQECLDFSRDLGLNEIPGSYRLVAGLDPAARGVQAAYLWAVKLPGLDPEPGRNQLEDERYHMVDLEAQKAGGIEGAELLMRDWFQKYGVTLWVVEDNSYQKVFFDDPRIKAAARELSLEVRPTHTGRNKHDPDFGVAGMAPLFHEGKVTLPYATREAQRKTDAYLKQLSNFTGDTGPSRHQSDILMASWFPHATVIKKWRREERATQIRTVNTVSYPEFGLQRTEAFWGETGYPYT